MAAADDTAAVEAAEAAKRMAEIMAQLQVDAEASMEEARSNGHTANPKLGCSPNCPACAKHPEPPTPEGEYKCIMSMLRHDLDHPVCRSVAKIYAITRQRLYALALHPKVTVQRDFDDQESGILLFVTVNILSSTGRSAVARVRCLLPLQGRTDKPYTPNDLPQQTSSRGRTSEGYDPQHKIQRQETPMERGTRVHAEVEKQLTEPTDYESVGQAIVKRFRAGESPGDLAREYKTSIPSVLECLRWAAGNYQGDPPVLDPAEPAAPGTVEKWTPILGPGDNKGDSEP